MLPVLTNTACKLSFIGVIVTSTLVSGPNKVGLKCPFVRTSVRPQKVSLINDGL